MAVRTEPGGFMNTVQLIDALRQRHKLPSDYAAAALLGLTRAQLSRYRNGKDFLGDEQALKVADLLGLEPGYVLACMHAERSKAPAVRSTWERIAKTFDHAPALAIFLAVILSALFGFDGGQDAGALAFSPIALANLPGSVCILCLLVLSAIALICRQIDADRLDRRPRPWDAAPAPV